MSNYVEHNNKIAFHPGYYIQEYITETGLTNEDFAIRLGTTMRTLNLLLSGKQRLTPDIAFRLSVLSGTCMEYWESLQNRYDELLLEFKADESPKYKENLITSV